MPLLVTKERRGGEGLFEFVTPCFYYEWRISTRVGGTEDRPIMNYSDCQLLQPFGKAEVAWPQYIRANKSHNKELQRTRAT